MSKKNFSLDGCSAPQYAFKIKSISKALNNLIKSYPEKELLMKGLLAEHNSKQSEPLFPSVFEMPILIDKFEGQEFEKGDEYIYWSN